MQGLSGRDPEVYYYIKRLMMQPTLLAPARALSAYTALGNHDRPDQRPLRCCKVPDKRSCLQRTLVFAQLSAESINS